jgi:CRISPR system Cascade subunit CasD
VLVQDEKECPIQKTTDFHTIKDARVNYSGLKSHETIITRREYLYDAEFTVAVWKTQDVEFSIDEIGAAIKKPIFTPFLGRRSCPLSIPLFEKIIESDDEFSALAIDGRKGGTIYSETKAKGMVFKVRDFPIWEQKRQFSSRLIYSHGG